jgi:Fe-S-cluster containining protein
MGKPRRPSRPRPVEPPPLGPEAGPTFGEVLEREGLVEKLGKATRDIITYVNDAAVEYTRVHLKVVSCYTCTVPACCSTMVSIFLYEAVPVVARLRREGRDTPELRAQLRSTAHEMETTRKEVYSRPCVLLGPDGRCTVYTDRPSICGLHLVSSPAERCGATGTTDIELISGPLVTAAQPDIADQFVLSVGLRPLPLHYRGAFARMVLLVLEAWDRRDYVTFLAVRALQAAHRNDWATR